jgi:CheY-specific phosphatase CheX
MNAQIDESSVIKANAQFWEQMLAMHLDHLPVAQDFCVEAGHLCASVRLSGVWSGRIEVRLTDKLAVTATAAMLMQSPESVAEADTLDATKEIANMIAGTIKSALPRPCEMTVPESNVESACYCSPAQTDDSLAVAFRHPDGDLMVRVLEQSPVQ